MSVLALLLAAGLAAAADRPKAVAVLIDSDPWLDVIGSDSPSVAVYEDGLVIFATSAGYRSARLAPARLAALKKELLGHGLDGIPRVNDLARVTDRPTTQIYLDVDRPRAADAYGLEWALERPEGSRPVPPPLKSVYRTLKALKPKDGRPWRPASFELMLWPFPHAEKASAWPKTWPGLEHPTTLKRREDAYSVFLPSSREKELDAFLERLAGDAVELNGKRWAVAVRAPFPGEARWKERLAQYGRR
jgi:hypothetical protein